MIDISMKRICLNLVIGGFVLCRTLLRVFSIFEIGFQEIGRVGLLRYFLRAHLPKKTIVGLIVSLEKCNLSDSIYMLFFKITIQFSHLRLTLSTETKKVAKIYNHVVCLWKCNFDISLSADVMHYNILYLPITISITLTSNRDVGKSRFPTKSELCVSILTPFNIHCFNGSGCLVKKRSFHVKTWNF